MSCNDIKAYYTGNIIVWIFTTFLDAKRNYNVKEIFFLNMVPKPDLNFTVVNKLFPLFFHFNSESKFLF